MQKSHVYCRTYRDLKKQYKSSLVTKSDHGIISLHALLYYVVSFFMSVPIKKDTQMLTLIIIIVIYDWFQCTEVCVCVCEREREREREQRRIRRRRTGHAPPV